MVTDYGTNAEMGLFYKGELYTGSAAAGPAMEGQSIEFGMLAAPEAISDLAIGPDGKWYNYVLDRQLKPMQGRTGRSPHRRGASYWRASRPAGITGTGVRGRRGRWAWRPGSSSCPMSTTPDKKMHLMNGISFERART